MQTNAIIKSEPENILAVIDRAAKDPAVDVSKMERLLDLAERMHARQSKAEYDQALSAAQAEMRPVSRDCHNPQTRSRYASYEAIDSAIRPIYTQHGFAMFFGTKASAQPNEVIVTCRVSHRAGHSETIELPMPADGKGSKGGDVMTRTHATGSALSYGQRYLAKLIWNLSFGESDDDGNAAARTPKPEPKVSPRGDSPASAPIPDQPKQRDMAFLRTRLLTKLNEAFGTETVAAYAQSVFSCHPGNWPLEKVPTTKADFEAVVANVELFAEQKAGLAPEKVSPRGDTFTPSDPIDVGPSGPSEEFWDVVITVPRAGTKRDEYLKSPDTIRSLYDATHAGDAKARTRLFGLANEWHPETRVVDGRNVPPSEPDVKCRAALDQFLEWRKSRPE